MESGSSCKKRKIDHQEYKEEEEEEAQMEKFYALIKSIRETRDQLMIKSKNRKRNNNNNNKIAVWKPTFELEDFVQDEAQRQNTTRAVALAAAGDNSQSQSQSEAAADGKKDQTGKGIDLTLSL